MCNHTPTCAAAESATPLAARATCTHPEQGWDLLCNGVICFDDGGAILPDGHVLSPVQRVAA